MRVASQDPAPALHAPVREGEIRSYIPEEEVGSGNLKTLSEKGQERNNQTCVLDVGVGKHSEEGKKMVGLTLPLKMLEAKQLGKLSKPAFCGRTEGKPRGSARY